MSVERNEAKYQLIKLVRSGRTLTEAMSMMKAASAALHPEYTSAKDINNLATLEGGLNRLAMTRNQAKKLTYKKFFKPRKDYPSTREETLAKFATRYKGGLPLNWKRDGNLIRRGPPNKPKPGSSAGKVRQTKVIGVEKTYIFESSLAPIILRPSIILGGRRGRARGAAARRGRRGAARVRPTWKYSHS